MCSLYVFHGTNWISGDIQYTLLTSCSCAANLETSERINIKTDNNNEGTLPVPRSVKEARCYVL
jgi:hypothetical protein